MKEPIKILIVDDHAVLRMGLSSLLDTKSEFKVVGDAENGEEAIAKHARLHPDVILMDLVIPGMNGVEITKRILADNPAAKVLVLTTFATSSGIAAALEAGAKGALLKSAPFREITQAIKAIHDGRTYVAGEIERILAEDPPIKALTPRQLAILKEMTRGLSNAEIARSLSISEDVVKNHVIAILARLDAANRTEAVSIAYRHHLVS